MMAPILTNAEVQQRLPPQRREFTSERRRDPEHTQLTSAPAVDEYVQQCLGLRAAWPAHESGLVCQRRLWTPPTEEVPLQGNLSPWPLQSGSVWADAVLAGCNHVEL
ncbi:uncharacterized protein [Trachinotus anak]|uniref:uncharacterized protein isoform X1 n=1 Tax=Trachinotus anak TaxID=443729 RepID=UPI0039F22D74